MTFRQFFLAGSAALSALLLPSCALETLAPPMGRSGDQLVFSGRTWTVKGGQELFGPGPNYFSKDLYSAYTDSLGYLHLNIRQLDGRWYCSEVISNENLGYGTYSWEVEPNQLDIPTNTVLGLFTWDNNTLQSQANSEVDIEVSRWGNPNQNNTLHTSVQPVWFGSFYPERTRGHALPEAARTQPTTHEFRWAPEEITWTSYLGPKSANNVIATWKFDLTNPARVKQEGGITSAPIIIPAPGTTTNARMNLWLMQDQNQGPTGGQTYEVVIRSFTYQPL